MTTKPFSSTGANSGGGERSSTILSTTNPELQDTNFSASLAVDAQDTTNNNGSKNANPSASTSKDVQVRLQSGVPTSYGAVPTTSSTSTGVAGSVKASTPTSGTTRVLAPDLLRGLLMVLMSLDHASLFMGAWRHGTPKTSESDSTVFTEWNFNSAYISRTLTHMCAPGFFFLMGMGTVYFTHSRKNRLGWKDSKITMHFVKRGLALAVVNQVMGWTMLAGRGLWVINIVLLGLAIDYVLSGCLCLLVARTETLLANALHRLMDSNSTTKFNNTQGNGNNNVQHHTTESSALLADSRQAEQEFAIAATSSKTKAKTLSFWFHNLILLGLAGVTIFWNIWLSGHHGHCTVSSESNASVVSSSSQSPASIEYFVLAQKVLTPQGFSVAATTAGTTSKFGPWFDFWFYSVQTAKVMSGFPPLAWISFCILGILYGRIMIYRKWTARSVVAINTGLGLVFSLLFVGTRLFHFGNLSENCLRMQHQVQNPEKNQYLVDWKSFFYITKYPPSPSFLFYAMACNFLLLAFFGALPPKFAVRLPGLINFGSSALFFYVCHMMLYKLLSIPARALFQHELPDKPPNDWENPLGLGDSTAFWITWLIGLAILNPTCKAYARFKQSKDADSLWRFF